jgi:hypothetical protein
MGKHGGFLLLIVIKHFLKSDFQFEKLVKIVSVNKKQPILKG